ncbi:MAG: diaminopimelate decarboxylase, partial [Planctomycetales bacterium]|nr:diaminopimelate decarboxylase [Planctomycetales bacterium]
MTTATPSDRTTSDRTAAAKPLPFTRAQLEEITRQYPTPFHIYDERAIRANARALNAAFAWSPGFREYFAVKATPNPHLLAILREEGFGADCSSAIELMLAKAVGMSGDDIMYTSNNTPAKEFVMARELQAIINLDDLTHVEYLNRHAGMPSQICFRYNPGPLREGNAIIGKPEDAKYGLTREQLFQAYPLAKKLGAQTFGLHTMVASNELNPAFFVETARMLFELCVALKERTGISIGFINLGGGIGIPYRPGQQPVDLQAVSDGVRAAYAKCIKPAGLAPLRILMENGRMVTGPYGYLVTRAIHEKHIYKEYVGVDACMANLMRPGMYGAYHHITVMGKEQSPHDHVYDVVGSLCENNDKFA